MAGTDMVLWKSTEEIQLPKKVEIDALISNFAPQLSVKDQNQIIKAFHSESFEMVSSYVWTKSIIALRNHLGKMGISFIAEMLDRPDLNDHINLQQAISEYEAIQLAEELGVINGTVAFRLKQAMETVAHFNQMDFIDDVDNEMNEDEAKTIVRSCIQGVLGYKKIEEAIDFKNFRTALEESTLTSENSYLVKLVQSPYFFLKTTIRILLALIKSSTGAHLENSLANANLIVPKIWDRLKHPERYQVGRVYAELSNDGKTKAASGLRQVLLKVRGFDFVPEDLRSNSFIKIANEIISAHENFNNFYNEPAPMQTLSKMGSVIPIPAFPACITATLCVKLGNRYGIARDAQSYANSVLKNVTPERWIYFFNEVLPSNQRLLFKLVSNNPSAERWVVMINSLDIDFGDILTNITVADSKNLLRNTILKKLDRVNKYASGLYQQMTNQS
jgi:hypothetical protein